MERRDDQASLGSVVNKILEKSETVTASFPDDSNSQRVNVMFRIERNKRVIGDGYNNKDQVDHGDGVIYIPTDTEPMRTKVFIKRGTKVKAVKTTGTPIKKKNDQKPQAQNAGPTVNPFEPALSILAIDKRMDSIEERLDKLSQEVVRSTNESLYAVAMVKELKNELAAQAQFLNGIDNKLNDIIKAKKLKKAKKVKGETSETKPGPKWVRVICEHCNTYGDYNAKEIIFNEYIGTTTFTCKICGIISLLDDNNVVRTW